MKKADTSKKSGYQKEALKRVLRYIRPYGFFVFASLLCSAISVAAQLLVPVFCGDAI